MITVSVYSIDALKFLISKRMFPYTRLQRVNILNDMIKKDARI